MAKYLHLEKLCNFLFVLFVTSWFITRHILYNTLLYSLYAAVPSATTLTYGCYNAYSAEPLPSSHPAASAKSLSLMEILGPLRSQGPDGIVCFNSQIKSIFLGLLGAIQVLSIIWFGMIMRVILSVIRGAPAEDTRSEDEDEDDEVEVEVEDLNSKPSLKRIADLESTTSDAAKEDSSRHFLQPDVNTYASSATEAAVGSSNWTDSAQHAGGLDRISSSNGHLSIRKSASTRRRLPNLWDAEERKELLARIGCDTPIGQQ